MAYWIFTTVYSAFSLTWTLSVLFTKAVKIMVIFLNARVLNIIHKHLLKENNCNNKTIEIRYVCIITNINMHIIHEQKNACLFSLQGFFVFLLCCFYECVFMGELLWKKDKFGWDMKYINIILRCFNFEPSSKLRWCRARDLFRS